MKINKSCLGTILNACGENGSAISSNTLTQITNAGIIAGTAFFSTLAGMAITDVLSGRGIVAAGIAAGLSFFTSLSIQRKVNPSQ
jgi:hypothetical protein